MNDLAEASLFVMDHYGGADILNVGVDDDISIHDVALMIADVVGFSGRLEYDPSKSDGTPRKLLDSGGSLGLRCVKGSSRRIGGNSAVYESRW